MYLWLLLPLLLLRLRLGLRLRGLRGLLLRLLGLRLFFLRFGRLYGFFGRCGSGFTLDARALLLFPFLVLFLLRLLACGVVLDLGRRFCRGCCRFRRAGFRSFIPETTKIIIAQRVASVQDADLILIMDNGRIADRGTHDELLSRCEIYREIYFQQNKGGEEHA